MTVPYLDGVEGVPRDDGADAAEPAGQKVLHLAHPLLLRHVAAVGLETCGSTQHSQV